MRFSQWLTSVGGWESVDKLGDGEFMFKRDGKPFGILRACFIGQKRIGPWLEKLGESDFCSEILTTVGDALPAISKLSPVARQMGVAVFLSGRVPKDNKGLISLRTGGKNGWKNLEYTKEYQDAFKVGFKVGLHPQWIIDGYERISRGDIEKYPAKLGRNFLLGN